MYTNEIFENRFDEILRGAANDSERASLELARIAVAIRIDSGHMFPIFAYDKGIPLWRGIMGVLMYQETPTRFVLVYGKYGERNEAIWLVMEAPDM